MRFGMDLAPAMQFAGLYHSDRHAASLSCANTGSVPSCVGEKKGCLPGGLVRGSGGVGLCPGSGTAQTGDNDPNARGNSVSR